MATTNLASYKALDLSTTDLCDQWPNIIKAIEGMAAVYQGKASTEPGTAEPDDTLTGWIFGFNPTFEWKIEASATGFEIANNTGVDTEAGATWAQKLNTSVTAVTATVPFLAPAGTELAPGFAFSAATGHGLRPAGAELHLTVGGVDWLKLRGSDDKLQFKLGVEIEGEDGLVTSPFYSFRNQAGTGMYRPAGGHVALASAGTQVGLFTNTTIDAPGTFRGGVGSAAAPTHSFTGVSGTGTYSDNGLAVTVAGVKVFAFEASGILKPTGPVRALDGNIGNPSYAFLNSTNTGWWWDATPVEAKLSVGGIVVMRAHAVNGVTFPLGITSGSGTVSLDTTTTTEIVYDPALFDSGTAPAVTTIVEGQRVGVAGCPGAQDVTEPLINPAWPGGHELLVGTNSAGTGTSTVFTGRANPADRFNVPNFAHEDHPEVGLTWQGNGSGLSTIVRGMNCFEAQVSTPSGELIAFVTVPPGWWQHSGGNRFRPGINAYGDTETGLLWGVDFNSTAGQCWFAAQNGVNISDVIGYWDSNGITLEGRRLWAGAAYDPVLSLPNGGVATPTLSWTNASAGTGGIGYNSGAASIRAVFNSKWAFQWGDANQLIVNGTAGTKAVPALAFDSNAAVGLYNPANAGNDRFLGLSASGQDILQLRGDAVAGDGSVMIGANCQLSSPSAPTLGRIGNTDTGVYWGPDSPATSKLLGLTVGGNTQLVLRDRGEFAFPKQPRTRVKITVADNLAAGTPLVVDWDAADYNSDPGVGPMWNSGGDVSQITTTAAGLFFIAFTTEFETSQPTTTAGTITVEVLSTLTPIHTFRYEYGATNVVDETIQWSDMIELASGANIELRVTVSDALVDLAKATMTLIRVNDTV